MQPRRNRTGGRAAERLTVSRTGVWALCGALALLGFDLLGSVAQSLQGHAALWVRLLLLVAALAIAAGGAWFYRSVVMRRWAAREPVELPRPDRRLALGVLLGAGFILLCFALVVAAGADRVTGPARFGPGDAIAVASLVVVSAVLEELIFRGVLLQALERWLGWVPALAITSALFGLIHLANPGATLFGALAIAVEAGFLLGAAFLWRRDLWLPIGIHAGWNATEALLGIPVSGETSHGLLHVTAVGPQVLTGGAFGIEASIPPMVVGAVLGTLLLLGRRRRVVVDPAPMDDVVAGPA